jgi:hypothetical protein
MSEAKHPAGETPDAPVDVCGGCGGIGTVSSVRGAWEGQNAPYYCEVKCDVCGGSGVAPEGSGPHVDDYGKAGGQ